ncbi:DHHC zinc finger domain containing protein [Trichomonas vaginalis G3]|uniref:Palmitoyltransferase n=1 Tax=Trichomonas vaginalis (strain ATCC PRA-98 / G3) TaxID=412133 RepID=A2EDB2_TRIV3|nr:cysteine S-palmitoyltransferase protein [Trichomonas vaginalis G3]EAY09370.1 DHHC zinc finger domain containing protein [Trichomonas vaginalis G3]KAI5501694.1 cysteine S-palmitoyltransferase protein [Trichomonas vaginalis G3]|eukprot:XP_001321593.1 DHHC zinc finger domain containing protein [Trichomonas vaginalis G3]
MVYWAPFRCADISARIIMILIYLFVTCTAIAFVFARYSSFPSKVRPYYFLVLILYIVFSVLWITAHINLSWLDAGSVERELEVYKNSPLSAQLEDRIANFSLCKKCHLPKSKRTHHCSQCKKCYFRFDHHCPAIGNCVALKNMKPFILFMVYSCFLVITAGSSALLYLGEDDSDMKIIYWLIFGSCCAMGIYVACFGLSFCGNTCNDHTTLEGIAKEDKHKYSLGSLTNFKQIFGEHWYEWFIPTQNKFGGFVWAQIHEEIDNRIQEATQQHDSSNTNPQPSDQQPDAPLTPEA